MMRPEQIKKFCPCCCFLCWAQYQNNINHLFIYLFFYILSPNQRNIPCSQGYAVILSFAQLSILAIASLFPFHHYFFTDFSLTQFKIFQPDCSFVENNFCCSCHSAVVDQANQHFCQLRQLERPLGR